MPTKARSTRTAASCRYFWGTFGGLRAQAVGFKGSRCLQIFGDSLILKVSEPLVYCPVTSLGSRWGDPQTPKHLGLAFQLKGKPPLNCWIIGSPGPDFVKSIFLVRMPRGAQ